MNEAVTLLTLNAKINSRRMLLSGVLESPADRRRDRPAYLYKRAPSYLSNIRVIPRIQNSRETPDGDDLSVYYVNRVPQSGETRKSRRGGASSPSPSSSRPARLGINFFVKVIPGPPPPYPLPSSPSPPLLRPAPHQKSVRRSQ